MLEETVPQAFWRGMVHVSLRGCSFFSFPIPDKIFVYVIRKTKRFILNLKSVVLGSQIDTHIVKGEKEKPGFNTTDNKIKRYIRNQGVP